AGAAPRGLPPVEPHCEVAAAGAGIRRQGGDRRRRAVELPAAVIGYHQGRRPVLDRGASVLDIEDALEDELAGPQAFNPFDVFPTQSRIELLRDPFRQYRDTAHAGMMANNIAERLALAAGDAERPCRLGGDVD